MSTTKITYFNNCDCVSPIYVKNNVRRFVGERIYLDIRDSDETLKFKYHFIHSQKRFTSQGVPKSYTTYVSPEGEIANNLILIADRTTLEDLNAEEKEFPRFRIGIRRFKSKMYYKPDSIIRLVSSVRNPCSRVWEHSVISEFPNTEEASVAMAPRKPQQQRVTTWAGLKSR